MIKRAVFLVFAFLLIQTANACVNTAEDYAVEVLLNKPNISYNLDKIRIADNIIERDNSFMFKSQYGNELMAILKEENCSNCLSLKLQLPVEVVSEKTPYFSLISLLSGKKINIESYETIYEGWKINKNDDNLIMRKNAIQLAYTSIGNRGDILLEIYEKMPDCKNCDGHCIYQSSNNPYGNICISKKMKDEIDRLLKFAASSNFNELFLNYRVIGNDEKLITNTKVISGGINWKDALKQELVFLRKEGVINLNNNDIESISNLAEKGKSGNSKIVYEDEWKYYYLSSSFIKKEPSCGSFMIDIPKYSPEFNANKNYYTFPIALAVILAITIALLVVLGRIINKTKPRKET